MFECGVWLCWTAGLDGVELLQLEVLELESGGCKTPTRYFQPSTLSKI